MIPEKFLLGLREREREEFLESLKVTVGFLEPETK